MATFVLVHGAFIGGWAFQRVATLLRSAGHEVFTPTLTGMGERAHLLGPSIGYDTHVNDVVNVLKYENIRNVILVGHSYSGNVVTGVCDRVPDRVREIVYLDSQIPTNGLNAMGASSDGTADTLGAMTASSGPKLLPALSLDAMGVFDAADRAWLESLIGPFPMKCLEDVVRLEHGDPTVRRSYIRCTARESLQAAFGGADPLGSFVEKAKKDNFAWFEIDSGHHPMITHPKELADLLQAIAAR